MSELYLGIDAGTTGIRTAVIDAVHKVVAEAAAPLPAPTKHLGQPAQDPLLWWKALQQCLRSQNEALEETGRQMEQIAALAVDGTSGTLLLADRNLKPLMPALMYNSGGFNEQAARIAAVAPADATANSPSSALARLLFMLEQPEAKGAHFALHQADWLAAKLMGRGGFSDETNVLKLGFDITARRWPQWLEQLELRTKLLPRVRPVGTVFAAVDAQIATQFGFDPQVAVIAGATDSNAAFIAAGAGRPGDAVTSLGTTLAVKLVSEQPVVDPARGIYSHRIGNMWLAGGASNTGGGALRKFFNAERMRELEPQLDPITPTGLDYYPLPEPGERFPIADAQLMPRCEPQPASAALFFQGLLEGIANIEKHGYECLAELGAPQLRSVVTVGGGARNAPWMEIRARILECNVTAGTADAAVGAARIASGNFLGSID